MNINNFGHWSAKDFEADKKRTHPIPDERRTLTDDEFNRIQSGELSKKFKNKVKQIGFK